MNTRAGAALSMDSNATKKRRELMKELANLGMKVGRSPVQDG
jgi:hypothetical protein